MKTKMPSIRPFRHILSEVPCSNVYIGIIRCSGTTVPGRAQVLTVSGQIGTAVRRRAGAQVEPFGGRALDVCLRYSETMEKINLVDYVPAHSPKGRHFLARTRKVRTCALYVCYDPGWGPPELQ